MDYFYGDDFDPNKADEYYENNCNVEYDEQSMDKDCIARLIPVD